MPRSFELYLQDMLQAGQKIQTFTAGKSFEDYESDSMLRAAVERLFEIIGEALSQVQLYHPDRQPVTAAQRKIIDFRNRVIHGYFDVNDEVVWSASKVYHPPSLGEVSALIQQAEAKPEKVDE
jgi:uncharacterized protein with HEPN domain